MTVLGLIRHGVTDWNIEKRVQGQTDIPLNSEGRIQAVKLANRLLEEKWDFIYSSDLGRAKDTAQAIADLKQLPVVTNPLLREIGCGQLEGLTGEEIVARWGADYRQLDLGMESKEDLAKRGVQVLNELAEKHPGRNILIVTHGAFIGITLKQLIPHVDTHAPLMNTSVTVLKKQPAGWDCDLFNCSIHLE